MLDFAPPCGQRIENDGMSTEEPKDSGGAQFIEEFEEQMFFHEKPSDLKVS